MFFTKELETAEDQLAAKQLLYKIYIQEENWNIDKNNPSGIRIETHNSIPYLEDNFKDLSTWFGVFKDHDLIGCGRTTKD